MFLLNVFFQKNDFIKVADMCKTIGTKEKGSLILRKNTFYITQPNFVSIENSKQGGN